MTNVDVFRKLRLCMILAGVGWGLLSGQLQALARRLGHGADSPLSSPDLAGSAFATPLMVAAAAYLRVAEGHVPTKQAELLDGLLIHEDRY